MRVAIPHWQGRVSPVFDMARSVLLIDIDNGQDQRREERKLTRTDSLARAAEFLKLGSEVLICGGISAPLEAALASSGVEVIGFVCGPVEEVLAAYLNGKLANRVFSMPGAHRRRRCFGGSGYAVERRFGMGAGRGPRGGGRCRRFEGGSGGMGAPFTVGQDGYCVCLNCGEKLPHTPGQPCNQMACPKCGLKMTREQSRKRR
jgi:predicted Fe-Mo cluster-binding NifX family protein